MSAKYTYTSETPEYTLCLTDPNAMVSEEGDCFKRFTMTPTANIQDVHDKCAANKGILANVLTQDIATWINNVLISEVNKFFIYNFHIKMFKAQLESLNSKPKFTKQFKH